jgi:hypothetical protein
VVSTLPWRIVDYWEMTRRADLDDFVTEPRRSQNAMLTSREMTKPWSPL